MANKKVMELVNFAEKAASEKWGYVWGGGGEIYTKENAEKLYKMYGTEKYNKTYYMTTQMKLWGEKRVVDCSGFIQAFRGMDDTADGLYSKCIEKGGIKSFNNHTGYLVFCVSNGKANHVGIVVSNSYVIHSIDSNTGVIKEKLSSSKKNWTHYGKAHFIDYIFDAPLKYPVEKNFSINDICFLQVLLNKQSNAGLDVDGIYGKLTDAARVYFKNTAAKYV